LNNIIKEFEKIYNYRTETSEIKNIDNEIKVAAVLYGIENEEMFGTSDGYRFGVEVSFEHFSITADEDELVVFSNYSDCIMPTYLHLKSTDDGFLKIYSKIKHFIIKHEEDEAIFLERGYKFN